VFGGIRVSFVNTIILILRFYLCVGILSCVLQTGFLKILCAFLVFQSEKIPVHMADALYIILPNHWFLHRRYGSRHKVKVARLHIRVWQTGLWREVLTEVNQLVWH